VNAFNNVDITKSDEELLANQGLTELSTTYLHSITATEQPTDLQADCKETKRACSIQKVFTFAFGCSFD
jgi:hypothetical protein